MENESKKDIFKKRANLIESMGMVYSAKDQRFFLPNDNPVGLPFVISENEVQNASPMVWKIFLNELRHQKKINGKKTDVVLTSLDSKCVIIENDIQKTFITNVESAKTTNEVERELVSRAVYELSLLKGLIENIFILFDPEFDSKMTFKSNLEIYKTIKLKIDQLGSIKEKVGLLIDKGEQKLK